MVFGDRHRLCSLFAGYVDNFILSVACRLASGW